MRITMRITNRRFICYVTTANYIITSHIYQFEKHHDEQTQCELNFEKLINMLIVILNFAFGMPRTNKLTIQHKQLKKTQQPNSV